MTIATNLAGRLRNTSLPASKGLLPLYEAVVNSIHAIEDATLSGCGNISITIQRDGQAVFAEDSARPGPEARADIVSFCISDDGIGFTEVNLDSFQTLDSEYKASRGGRGVGRLLWLKAFARVEIDSYFAPEVGGIARRRFAFTAAEGVSGQSVAEAIAEKSGTTVTLKQFVSRYREAVPKTAGAIAKCILEHCLWYFVRPGGAPNIAVSDEEGRISLNELYEEHMHSMSKVQSVSLKGVEFQLLHVKLTDLASHGHGVAYCADGRLVKREGLKGKVPGLHGPLSDPDGDFVYECYVSSPLLDERVRSERTEFDIDEETPELFAGQDVSQRDIREIVVQAAQEYLAEQLEEVRSRGRNRLDMFVAEAAPKYRPILRHMSDGELAVDPNISDKELELHLHRQYAAVEEQVLADGHQLLQPDPGEPYESYHGKLNDYLATAADLKQSDLASPTYS